MVKRSTPEEGGTTASFPRGTESAPPTAQLARSIWGIIMRLTMAVITVTLLAVAPASAQAPTSEQHPYGLDPYKPSDAALLRNYGAALVAQTPLLELRQLDPYKPSHAALLRQLGGAIPLWSHLSWYPTAARPAPLTPSPTTGATGGVTPTGPNVAAIVVPPNNRLSPPRQLQDRELDRFPRPELQPGQPKRPGFRAPQRAGSSDPALFLAQEIGAETSTQRGNSPQ